MQGRTSDEDRISSTQIRMRSRQQDILILWRVARSVRKAWTIGRNL
jgi:hypothetical protein